MKTKTLFYMALTAVMTTLAACSQDDELMDAAPKQAQIEFEITDGGYGGDEATRAKEEGFRTKFTAGDKCGLYIIDNGEFIASNVKLTAEEGENGEITWKAADGAISNVTDNSKYFLYYPYQIELYGSEAQLGDDDKTVFKNLIDGFGFDWYQYTQNLYTQSDLMTATGTASTGADGKLKVSFSMTHQMALAVIEVPKTVYKFEGTSIPNYTVASSVDFSGSNYKPLHMEDGTYRFVFNPNLTDIKSITGTINGRNFTISADKLKGIDKGTYKTFRIGGADATEEKEHTLQVGDYLLKDGNLVGKDNLSESQKSDVAAIVFSIGHNGYDLSNYSATGIGTEKCHGYAVALTNASSGSCLWGPKDTKLGLCPSGEINNKDNPEQDWSGYLYTQTIIKAVNDAGNSLKGNSADGYPATYYTVNYSTEAPATTSGWFLPAIGQLKEVLQQKGMFTGTVGTAPSGSCWSSSEYSGNQGNVLNVNFYNSTINSVAKTPNENSVRAILAF